MTTKTKLSLVASLLIATQTLQADTKDLGTITVSSATKSEQSIKDVTSTVEVISGDELEAKHITTVSEALNQISGVNYTSNGGLGKQTSVFVRGFSSNRVLVLIDGIRYNDVTSVSGAGFAHLMVTDIERIEVIKGAQSGIWGADASAGVINIITKKADLGTHGSVNAEYGSFSTKKYGAHISHATKDFSVKASYQKVDTDGFSAYKEKGTDLDSYEDDAYENETANAEFSYNINDENKIEVSHTIIKAEGEIDSSFSGDVSDSSNKIDNSFSKIKYENITNISKNEIYLNRSNFDWESTSSGSTNEFDGNSNEFGINSNIPYGKGKDFLMVGVDYTKFEHENSIASDYTNKAVFLTNSNYFDDTLALTESIRADRYDAFDNKTTGKIGAKYNFSKDLYVSSNIGTAYNVPTLSQLYASYGNPDLNPESTTSYEATLGYTHTKITYFYNTVEDMIDWDNGYTNLEGESKLKGLEIDYKNEIVNNILLSLNYTKLSAKNNDGKDLARRADQTLKFGIDYFGFDKFHFNLNGEYVGDRYDSDDKQGAQTGRYTVMNLVVNYEVSNDIETYVKVDNIADKDYQVVENYATSPRAAYAGVKVNF
jgi:vitamin B12 transporter